MWLVAGDSDDHAGLPCRAAPVNAATCKGYGQTRTSGAVPAPGHTVDDRDGGPEAGAGGAYPAEGRMSPPDPYEAGLRTAGKPSSRWVVCPLVKGARSSPRTLSAATKSPPARKTRELCEHTVLAVVGGNAVQHVERDRR
jgi:hypothetical protein